MSRSYPKQLTKHQLLRDPESIAATTMRQEFNFPSYLRLHATVDDRDDPGCKSFEVVNPT